MSRRSFFLTIAIACFLVGGSGACLFLLFRHEPAYYRRAAIPEGENRTRFSQEFLSEFSEFVSAIGTDKSGWYGRFSDQQINSYLEEAFLRCGLGDKLLPDGISHPRMVFEKDRLQIGFRYRSRLVQTIVTISMRVWLPGVESNVVALQLEGFRAGALPFSAQWLMERLSESARQNGIEVNWYRHGGHPVALLRFQADQARATLQIKAIQLEPGRITIHGKSSDDRVRAVSPDRWLALALPVWSEMVDPGELPIVPIASLKQ
ncbi:MAG: hypothetical protein ACKO23_12860 [Gemmataceae bacterium]